MAAMPRDTNQRYIQPTDRRTRSKSSSNFVDTLLPAVSSPKKIRLNSPNSNSSMDHPTSDPFTASSTLSALVYGHQSSETNGHRSESERSSILEEPIDPFLAHEEEERSPPPQNGADGGSNYFACVHCNKYFWTETSLKHHSSLYHSEKSFVCEICGKAFRFRSNLAEHRSVHTSLKPYVCKFCGKSSRLKGNLTKHILKHHKKEQNAYIGKDDIIIKKGKKSIKDPAAVDFLEKSMIVLTSSTANSPISISNTPITTICGGKSTITSTSTSVNNDLGSAAMQLVTMVSCKNDQKPKSVIRKNSGQSIAPKLNQSISKPYLPTVKTKECTRLPMPVNTDEFNDHPSATPDQSKIDYEEIFNAATRNQQRSDVDAIFESLLGRNLNQTTRTSSTPVDFAEDACKSIDHSVSDRSKSINGVGTRCQLCGKHFRKSTNLNVHMTLKHNQTVPVIAQSKLSNLNAPKCIADIVKTGQRQNSNSATLSNGRPSEAPAAATVTQAYPQFDALNGLMTKSGVSRDLKEIRQVLQELKRGLPDVAKLDELLSALDARVDRLERQLETSVNTLYVLVQMQTDMNSAFTQFKRDVVQRLKSLKSQHDGRIQHGSDDSDDLDEDEHPFAMDIGQG